MAAEKAKPMVAAASSAAIFALAMIAIVAWAMFTGRVSAEASVPYFIALSIVGGIAQFTAGIIDLMNHDYVGGNIFLYFGLFFMLLGAFAFIFEWWGSTLGIEAAAAIEGYAWIILFIAMIGFTIAFAYHNYFFFVGCSIFSIAFIGVILMKFGVGLPASAHVGGWGLLLGAVPCLWVGLALVVNMGVGRPVLPAGGPLFGK